MQQTTTTDPFYFLSDEGEMARLMRQKDWSQTSLGPPDTWSQPLRTIISTCLNSHFPMLIWWGPERVMLYNDASKIILGDKQPTLLGSWGKTVWPEIWDTISPMLNGVLTRGEAIWSENQRVLINRHGYEEEGYFTFSYSPIHDESGGIGGVFCAVTETTATVLAERQLRELNRTRQENEQQLQGLFEQAPVTIGILHGPTFVVELANPRICEVWNRTPDQLLGRPIFEVLTETAGQGFEQLLTGVLQTGIPFEGRELPVTFIRNGEPQTVFVNFVYEPLRDAGDDRVTGIVVVGTDVTDLVQSRQRVEASEQLLNSMIRQTPLGVGIFVGPGFRIDLANPTLCQLWGRTAEQVLGKSLFEALPEAAGQGFEELLTGVFETGIPFAGRELPVTLVRKEHLETVYFDFIYEPLRSSDGRIERVMVVATDRTEAREGRLAVETSEARFRTIVQQSPAATLVLRGDDYVIDQINQPMLTFMGRGNEVVGQSLLVVMPELENQFAWQQVQRVYQEDISFDQHEVVVSHSRTGVLQDYYYNIAYRPLRERGAIIGMIQVVTDVTEQVMARQKLEESEERHRLAIEAANLGTWDYDLVTHLIQCSPRTVELFGFAPGETVSLQRAVDAVIKEDRNRVAEAVAFALQPESGGHYDIEYSLTNYTDGERRTIKATGKAYFTDKGVVYRFIGTALDVTEQKRAEDALRQADQRKDEFLALLAHELRNPLATLHNTLLILQLTGGKAENMTLPTATTLMNREVAHLVRLVDDLLDVSRISRGQVSLSIERIDVVALVRGAVEAAQTQYRSSDRALTVSLPNEPTYLDGDAARLKQVVSNLLNNALKFTHDGGHVWLTLEQLDSQAVLRVRDDGIGIPAHELERIFEMFVQVDNSLGRSQGGLGLGLTLVNELVQLHGGRVEAQSAGEGQGSEFVVYLPVEPINIDAMQPIPTEQPSFGPKRRMLIVDDNQDAAITFSMLLKLLGNEVHTRYDGQAGIEAAQRLRPQVIVLDISMPGLDGYQTCKLIRAQPWGKAMTLIALSGYGQAEDKRRTQAAGFDHHLVKPVDITDLSRLLDALPVFS